MFLQFRRLGTVKVLDALRASDSLYVARLAWQVPKDGYTLTDQAARLRKPRKLDAEYCDSRLLSIANSLAKEPSLAKQAYHCVCSPDQPEYVVTKRSRSKEIAPAICTGF
jgi:hypothetical protein